MERQRKKEIRCVDTKEYLDEMLFLINEGKKAVIPISGNSMRPFLIHGRDFVLLAPAAGSAARGDIVLYHRKNGQYVLHRVCKKGKRRCYMAGDAQNVLEGPISFEQIDAVAIKIKRNGKWISRFDFWNLFFRHVWSRIVKKRIYVLHLWHMLH